jgi:hypothetical protein
MSTKRIDVERLVVISSEPFERVVARLEATFVRPVTVLVDQRPDRTTIR